MSKDYILNKIEHELLSRHADDIEPLLVLYNDITKDMPGITINQISNSLNRLLNMGFSKCYFVTKGKWSVCKTNNSRDIEAHIRSYTHEENVNYQSIIIDDYYFEITQEGKIEAAKTIYDAYYPLT